MDSGVIIMLHGVRVQQTSLVGFLPPALDQPLGWSGHALIRMGQNFRVGAPGSGAGRLAVCNQG